MNLAQQQVLVVDDDPMILEILSQQLESFGVGSIQTAEDGNSALALLRQDNSVTTLLSDVSMPDMDWPARIAALLAADDRLAAERLAHSLKGGAATLGLLLLSASAATVEQQFECGEAHDLAGLATALNAVCPTLIAVAGMARSS